MLIENQEALKQWLTGNLSPLCDADPEVLGRYCLALLRKEKPISELKADMLEQLDVFLQSNTKTFVEKFLDVVESHSYLPADTSSPAGTIKPSGSQESEQQVPENSPDSTTVTTSTVPSVNCTASVNSSVLSSDSELPPLPPNPPPSSVVIPEPPPESAPPLPSASEGQQLSSVIYKPKKSETEKYKDRDGEAHKVRRKFRSSPSPSRSQSRERNKRSRSRGRIRRSRYDERRNKSPHSKRYRRSRSRSPRWSRSPHRSWSRERSRTRERRTRSRDRKSRSRDRRSHSRDRRSREKTLRSHDKLPRSGDLHSHLRSRSPIDTGHLDSPGSSPSPLGKGDRSDDSLSHEGKKEVMGHTLHSVVPVSRSDIFSGMKSQRCRDYDEKGVCMRGDLCPFDHGADPVVVESIGNVIDYPPPSSATIAGGLGSGRPLYAPEHGTTLHDRSSFRGSGLGQNRQNQFGEYTPSNPSMWGSEGNITSDMYYDSVSSHQMRTSELPIGDLPPHLHFTHPPPPLPASYQGRELISVPVNSGQQAKLNIRPSLAQRLGPVSRLQQLSSGAVECCTLELRKIPPGLNTIAHLNQHFSKFGTITNIQVQHKGDPEAAIVTFSTHAGANSAYRSTEAVFNNRFIKVFWHNPLRNADMSKAAGTNASQKSYLDIKPGMRHPNRTLTKSKNFDEDSAAKQNKVVISGGSLSRTICTTASSTDVNVLEKELPGPQVGGSTTPTHSSTNEQSAVPAAPDSTQQMSSFEAKQHEIETILRQQEQLRAELAAKNRVEKQKAQAKKIMDEVEQRKKQLLDKQVQQLKVLLNKFDSNKSNLKPQEKKALLTTIKQLQAAIDSTRAQILSPPAQLLSKLDKGTPYKHQEVHSMHCEADVSSLKHKLSHIDTDMKSGKPATPLYKTFSRTGVHGAHRGRGRGSLYSSPRVTRGRGRGRIYGLSSYVDRRSSTINASGFEREDKEEVLTHFASLGKITSYSWDDQTPSIVLQYSSWREAEKVVAEGRMLGDRLLTITWAPDPAPFELLNSEGEEKKEAENQPVESETKPDPQPVSDTNSEEVVEITEDIVEELETEDLDQETALLYEDEVEVEEEEEDRSWRH